MHAARLSKSPRLRRTLAALDAAGSRGMTTLELIQRTGSVAPHSDCAELRANGLRVRCDLETRAMWGPRVYRYRLEAGEAEA